MIASLGYLGGMKLRRAATVTVLTLTASGCAFAANDWQNIVFVSSTAGAVRSDTLVYVPPGAAWSAFITGGDSPVSIAPCGK